MEASVLLALIGLAGLITRALVHLEARRATKQKTEAPDAANTT